MSSADLGLSLVDDPVSTNGLDAAGDKEEELAVLPPVLHRVGALLSTAEGKPTVLHRLLVGALAGYMVLHFSGGSFLPAIYYLRLADALQNHVAFVGGPTFAGITALNSLRQVTRRGGFLVQLGADSVLLPRAVVEQLEGAQRRLKCGGSVVVVMVLCFSSGWASSLEAQSSSCG